MRVMIVDRWLETRELLGALLERDGAEVIAVARLQVATAMVSSRRPDVIVYDAEDDDAVVDRSELAAAAGGIQAPVVVVGSVKRGASALPTDRFVSKPYHYRQLLRKIEGCISG